MNIKSRIVQAIILIALFIVSVLLFVNRDSGAATEDNSAYVSPAP